MGGTNSAKQRPCLICFAGRRLRPLPVGISGTAAHIIVGVRIALLVAFALFGLLMLSSRIHVAAAHIVAARVAGRIGVLREGQAAKTQGAQER